MRKKECARARKGGKVAKDCVCPISGCSGESKSRLAKAAGIEFCGEMREGKTCALLWCEADVFKKAQTRHVRSSFGSSLVENYLHSIVARTACARKGWKVARVFVFPICWGSGRSTSMPAEAVGAEPFGEMRGEGKKRGRFCGKIAVK